MEKSTQNKDWKNISNEFTDELRQEWENKRFSYEECKEWINIGLNIEDSGYCEWLRDIKKLDAERVLNNEDRQNLRKEYASETKSSSEINDNKLNKHFEFLVIPENKNLKRKTSEFSIIEKIDWKETIEKEIKKNDIEGEIKEIETFSTWFNPNCAVITSDSNKEEKEFDVSLVIYDETKGKLHFIKKIFTTSQQKVEEDIESFKKKLDGEIPILALLEEGTREIRFSDVISKSKIERNVNNPDNYIKQYNIVDVRMDDNPFKHAAIYIGNGRVAHISGDEHKQQRYWKAQEGTWNKFLETHKRSNYITSYHIIIPFKKPKVIEKHIKLAIDAEYGLSNYNLFTRNCEHFATLCVTGISFSPQAYLMFKDWTNEKIDKKQLCREIKENVKLFIEWEKEEEEKRRESISVIIAQEWLDNTYLKENNKEKLREIKSDDANTRKRLEGNLCLDGFINLRELYLNHDGITELSISNCPMLEKLTFVENYPTQLNFLRDLVNPEKLTYLNIMNNNFSEQNLDLFSKFINLEVLYIGTDNEERIRNNLYNRFTGSLKPLSKLTKLKELNIESTDIDKGLKYLPKNLESFYYRSFREGAEVEKIGKKLFPYEKRDLEDVISGNVREIIDGYKKSKSIKDIFRKKTNNEVKGIESKIIKKTNILGEIKEIILFSTESDGKYAIVINKVVWYSVRLISYEIISDEEVKVTSVKRFPNLVDFYLTLEEAKNKAESIKLGQELLNQDSYEIESQEGSAINVLLIGRTGGGKSTLANVLSGTDKFTESAGSVSKTRNFQSKEFEWEENKYRVVDTIGIDDTNLSKREVLLKTAEGIYLMKEGINQVLFVLEKRFTIQEIEVFELLKSAILESGITKYITIVRTHFPNFKNFRKCEEDLQQLLKESEKIKEIINSCNGVIHVDNPSIDIDDEDEKIIYLKKRNDSRKKLLNHLSSSKCRDPYKPYPKSWDQVYLRVGNYIKKKHSLENRLEISSDNKKVEEEIKNIENKVIEEGGKELELYYYAIEMSPIFNLPPKSRCTIL